MLSPEVWSFPIPNHHTEINKGIFNENILQNKINSHYFNEMISIVVPNSVEIPKEAVDVLADSDGYIVKSISLVEFIKKQFIENFIKKGIFYAISFDTRIDTDECVVITPCGKLCLSLNKEIYQSSGLEGKLSYFSKKKQDRYIVHIDLQNPDLLKGKAYYKRLSSILSSDLLPRFNLLFTWTPPSSTICISSIAKYFSDLNYSVDLRQTTEKLLHRKNIKIPKFSLDNISKIDFDYYVSSLTEFIGMLTLSCNLEKTNYFSSYVYENEVDKKGTFGIGKWKGIFTCQQIKDLVTKLRNFMKQNNTIPWISIYVHGFSHSPISFNLKEHTFTVNGNNSYVIILTQDDKFVYYKILASNKTLK